MGLGAGELALILVIAYVVVGPEDMVKLARTLARTLRQIRKLQMELLIRSMHFLQQLM